MADAPAKPLPTADATAAGANRTVTTILNDAIPLAETALIAAYPPLAWPILKQIWEAIFSYFVGQLIGALGTVTGYVVMDVQKYMALTAAGNALAALDAAKKAGNTDAIEQASKDVDSAVTPILHFIGSS